MYAQLKHSLTNDTHYWISGLLIVAVLFIYGQTIDHDFIPYDDPHYIYDNPRVLEGLSWENFKWSWTTFEFSNWHPLTWMSMMLDVNLFGQNAGLHHMTSVVFHLLNSFLVYIVVLNLTKAPWRSGLCAILFAVHPLHIESVAWASERKDVLAAFFGLISVYFYTQYARNETYRHYVYSIAAFALGLCCKPMLVTWPFLFLLLDYWPLNRFHDLSFKQCTRFVVEKVPLLSLSIIVSALTYLAQDASGSVASVQKFPVHIRFMNSVISYFEYILMTIYPNNLAVIYPHIIETISTAHFLISLSVLIVLSAVSLWRIKKTPALFVGLAWFLGVLVPVIGLVQVGGASMADRYTYLPHIGLFIAAIWGVHALVARYQKLQPIAVVVCIVYCVGLAWAANQQTTRWNNGITLFTHTLKVTPGNTKAYTALGLSYARYGKHKEALDWFEGARQLDPGNSGGHLNLGVALTALNRHDDAIKAFRAGLAIDPENGMAHSRIGLAYIILEEFEKAEKSFDAALALDPDNPENHFNLALAYYHEKKFPESRASVQKALALRPSYVEAEVLFDKVIQIIEQNAPEQL
jgi:Tfp pilus assembly protein PilF